MNPILSLRIYGEMSVVYPAFKYPSHSCLPCIHSPPCDHITSQYRPSPWLSCWKSCLTSQSLTCQNSLLKCREPALLVKPVRYLQLTRASYINLYFLGHYRNPIWSDLKGEFPLLTLPEVFESGLRQARPKPFLGHRALVTSEPLVYETEYTWQTYADVDRRRRAVGSALENLFQKGELARGEDFETVGIWSINRPGRTSV